MGIVASAVLGLHTLLNGHAIFASYGTDLEVFLGPPLDRTPPIEVLVGSWGEDAEEDGVRLTQRWATLGASAAQRDKTVHVPCCVGVIGGEVAMDERLTTADAVFTAIDGLLTAQDPLGLPAVLCGGVEVTEVGVALIQSTGGASVVYRFVVSVEARE